MKNKNSFKENSIDFLKMVSNFCLTVVFLVKFAFLKQDSVQNLPPIGFHGAGNKAVMDFFSKKCGIISFIYGKTDLKIYACNS